MWHKISSAVKKYFPDLLVFLMCVSLFLVLFFRFVPVPGTLLMVKRLVTSSSDDQLSYSWTSWHNIAPFPKVCAMASEDQMLPFHHGLDISSLVDALQSNGKKRLRGASTISQQVAKNVFLYPTRSFIRKGFELYFAFMIESLWTKQRILEVYLNIAETGVKTFGVDAAANKYFKKDAGSLALRESALIIASLPNPIKYKVSAPGSYLKKRQNQISSLYRSLDGQYYLRELYVKTESSLYDFSAYKQ
jgi:monofunctional biosynthetic peptidoglycan transglycosylase